MTKKLISSLFGVSGIFGTSLKLHAFGNKEEKQNKKISPKTSINFLSSQTAGKNELKSFNYKWENRSLDGSHFGAWKYQSEGATEDIYLIKKDNSVLKVSASNYGQKNRVLNDGIWIDRNNPWFGYRSISKQFKRGEEKIKNYSEAIKEYKQALQSFSKEELRQLGLWWADLREDQQCDIVDVFVDCSKLRWSLGGNKLTWITDGLKIRPEKLVDLGRDSSEGFPKLSKIIGSRGLIDLPKKAKDVGNLIGGAIDNWIDEFIKNNGSVSLEKDGINPIWLFNKLIFGNPTNFKECEKVGEGDKFFPECRKQLYSVIDRESFNDGEVNVLPKLKEVVKAGTIYNSSDIRVSVGSKENQKLDEDTKDWKHEEKEENREKKQKIITAWKDKGIHEGIIDVSCKKFEPTSSLWSFITLDWATIGKQKGCEFIWKLIFSGEVDDKRLCLFEIPAAKHYLREYQITFFSYSNWYKNNKFWARCSEYGL
ncbi:hypothetical protein [Mycoplasma parvum]|uniref:Uncharacterized protein n=1 Tax=Mycoplasma parvum str. Indiana TaxID=1403316 RepID=U5NC34_9MOLU|nr:hypothetical protein [Mycoplasma parvum]AGX88972.1 hypothetical protein PRV_01040 [Mycoplasma parvum str. Indiana]